MIDARSIVSCFALVASGCCGQVGPCPQNDVSVVVNVDGSSVPVVIEGHAFECTEGEGETVCRTGTIAEGSYELTVLVDGYEPQLVTLSVGAPRSPPYSCECRIPRGSALVELGGEEPEDRDAAGDEPDSSAPEPDAGEPDGS